MTDQRALLLDVGNTRLKWGFLANGRISKTGGMTHVKLQETGFSALTSRIPRNVTDVMVSNVAGASVATKLSGVIGMHRDVDVHFAHTEKSAFGITNGYRQPRRMGVDRWVAMIGARSEFKTALCIVDAGTAITIDALDKSGQHLGGQIIPGIRLMIESLSARTSDIAVGSKRQRDPGTGLDTFARNTRDAVSFGAITAACGAVEHAAARLTGAGLRPKIVLTGGDASRILKHLKNNTIHRPNLVLQGLATMVQNPE